MRFLCILLLTILVPLSADSSVSAQGTDSYHLPIIFTPPTVAPFMFGISTQCTGDFGSFMAVPARYAYGFQRLYVNTEVEGGTGRTWWFEWLIDGAPAPGLDSTGTIADFVQVVDEVVVYGPLGSCEKAIPRGVYTVRIYLDNQLFQEGSATIQ